MTYNCNCWEVGRSLCDVHGQPSLPGLVQPRAEVRQPLGFAVKPLVGHTGKPIRCGSSVVSDGQAMREALAGLVEAVNAEVACPFCLTEPPAHNAGCPMVLAMTVLEA